MKVSQEVEASFFLVKNVIGNQTMGKGDDQGGSWSILEKIKMIGKDRAVILFERGGGHELHHHIY